ncbi:TetR/AcrR family transcriptional regulator [Brachybacterium alimentarium]|uniref:TetR/AcrR family transcriptional regulator n=1 Tax=Brachybacterium alimentarium TaxID=47845 RepID=UPI000DF26129|nr:TetR family transcriptional regulator C-terminal domain-containing protein [Brachybacterium alimentarium]RCS79834.1 TetR family transcriptional regulator [Brachybacterium alimentarium]
MFERSTDKAAREAAVAAAALRLITRDGDAALTVRRVAAEAQIPPTSLRDQFPSQDAVREVMMRAVAQRLQERIDALPLEPAGTHWGRAVLLELLPLSQLRRQEAIATLYLSAAALHDPARRAAWKLVDDVAHQACARALEAMGLGGNPARLDQLRSLVDGLTRQMLLQADERPAAWGAAVLDRMLPS